MLLVERSDKRLWDLAAGTARSIGFGNLGRSPSHPMVLPCHEPSLLSSPTARWEWQGRTWMFFDCACATAAARLSGFVVLVIAASDIAVRSAEPQPGGSSTAKPTAAISKVRRDA